MTRPSIEALDAEYRAKGWPPIDHRRADYCYQPCHTGLHVCGEHPDGVNALTVANLPTRTAAEARALFERAKADLACAEDEPAELIVDLMQGGDCEHDFPISRQMLDRLLAMGAAHA